MRTVLRPVPSPALVVAVALLFIAPLAASTDKDGVLATAGSPAEVELLGSWVGTVAPVGSDEVLDGGIIAIDRDPAGLVVTVGPNSRVRYRSQRIALTPRGIRFEVSLPGDQTRLLVYDLAVDGATLTGQVTFVRHGLTAPAHVAFRRQ